MNMHKSGLAFVAFFIVLALVVSAARQNGWGYPHKRELKEGKGKKAKQEPSVIK